MASALPPEPKLDPPGRGRIYDSIIETIGNTPLVEWNRWHDQRWGSCVCGRTACDTDGENRLGQILMQLRTDLAATPAPPAPPAHSPSSSTPAPRPRPPASGGGGNAKATSWPSGETATRTMWSLWAGYSIRVRPVAAPRGILFDRTGLPLVDNRPAFTLVVVPRDAPDLDAALARLRPGAELLVGADQPLELVDVAHRQAVADEDARAG